MMRSAWIGLTLGLLVAASCLADTVYLTNGNAFEGVIAQRTERGIRIILPYGDITLPADHVARIVSSDSPLAHFLARFHALASDPGTKAGDWVELGSWALDQGLKESAAKAALRAAALAPRNTALATLMRRLDYRYDADLASWVPHAEYLRRRGFVLRNGAWLSPGEVARRAAVEHKAQQAAAAAERRRDREETSDLLKAAAFLALSNSTANQRQATAPGAYLWPVASFPAYYGFSLHSREHPAFRQPRPKAVKVIRPFQLSTTSANYSFYNRPPGSLDKADLHLAPAPRGDHPAGGD